MVSCCICWEESIFQSQHTRYHFCALKQVTFPLRNLIFSLAKLGSYISTLKPQNCRKGHMRPLLGNHLPTWARMMIVSGGDNRVPAVAILMLFMAVHDCFCCPFFLYSSHLCHSIPHSSSRVDQLPQKSFPCYLIFKSTLNSALFKNFQSILPLCLYRHHTYHADFTPGLPRHPFALFSIPLSRLNNKRC